MPVTEQDSDLHLIALIQDGARTAFATLVARHHRYFYQIAYRQLADIGHAEDAVQECFIKFWQKPELFDLKRKTTFRSWFTRILLNYCIDIQRRKPMVELDTNLAMEDSSDNIDQHQAVQNALMSLPERQRSAVNLCYYIGHSNQEAADMLGIHRKALESLLMRAKTTLKKMLQRDEE